MVLPPTVQRGSLGPLLANTTARAQGGYKARNAQCQDTLNNNVTSSAGDVTRPKILVFTKTGGYFRQT
jgi:hypothetical protein